MSKPVEVIVEFVEKLIEDGVKLLGTEHRKERGGLTSGPYVDLQEFHKWCASCRLLLQQLGGFGQPWQAVLSDSKATNFVSTVRPMLGCLESIRESAQLGRLSSFEELVFAEAFANLIDQADYLIGKNWHLPAGVILRSVLEERLRRLCVVHNEMPPKQRPTIGDYTQSLYKARICDKIVMKQIEAMAAVGNAAAHCKDADDFDPKSIVQFHSNLISFLARFDPK